MITPTIILPIIPGVKLVYGRATGFGGYGADKVKKGGTLIEILPDQKTYSFESIFPDGTSWKQKKEKIREFIELSPVPLPMKIGRGQ